MECDMKWLTITWRIENYDFCLQAPGLESPSFFIDSKKDTTWKFVLEPKLQNEHIRLYCKKNAATYVIPELHSEISIFYGSDSSPSLKEWVVNGPDTLFSCHVPHNKMYDREENELNPAKIFTIRCRIYGPVESHLEVGQCFIRTRMRVIRTAYIGLVKEFSLIPFHEERTLEIKSIAAAIPFFTTVISLEGELHGSDRIWIQIVPYRKDNKKFCICELFLLDSEGVKKKCTRSKILFHKDQPQEWKFPLSFNRSNLLAKKAQFLPNNTLTLKLEIAFTTGIEYEQIEDSEFGFYVTENYTVCPSAMDDLARLYEEGVLSDIKLCTETETFHVHKNILGARSPVFKTMFTTGMRENSNDWVHIVDLDADTVRLMLKFLYSDNLEDLDSESSKCLYQAANKYNIEVLKHRCYKCFKDSLKPSNCCDILFLSEMYNDKYLKKIVMEFISYHPEEVFHSSEWKEFLKTNHVLALDAFYFVFL